MKDTPPKMRDIWWWWWWWWWWWRWKDQVRHNTLPGGSSSWWIIRLISSDDVTWRIWRIIQSLTASETDHTQTTESSIDRFGLISRVFNTLFPTIFADTLATFEHSLTAAFDSQAHCARR